MKQNMLSLAGLKMLLAVNDQETVKTMRSRAPEATKRLFELQLHKALIKDLIIEELELQLLDKVG